MIGQPASARAQSSSLIHEQDLSLSSCAARGLQGFGSGLGLKCTLGPSDTGCPLSNTHGCRCQAANTNQSLSSHFLPSGSWSWSIFLPARAKAYLHSTLLIFSLHWTRYSSILFAESLPYVFVIYGDPRRRWSWGPRWSLSIHAIGRYDKGTKLFGGKCIKSVRGHSWSSLGFYLLWWTPTSHSPWHPLKH